MLVYFSAGGDFVCSEQGLFNCGGLSSMCRVVTSPVCVAMNRVGRRFQGYSSCCDGVFYNGDSERSKCKFRTVECTEVEKLLRPPRPPPCLFFPSYLLSEHVTVCRKAASWNFLTPLKVNCLRFVDGKVIV